MSIQSQISTESHPGEKTKKYDRQLRLWGDHGQSALEMAKVCLVNANATGTEIMKNLILPGVGSFTIIDDNKVGGEDVGNNFFLDKDSIGKSRAHAATEFLLELNEDVNGDFIEESVDNLLQNNPTFFNNFTVVIACGLTEKSLLDLANLLWDNDIPLLVCRSYGLIGYLRIVLKEHTVIESHPDSALDDLRLDSPFPGLSDYCKNLDLEAMSKKDHSHTPWLVILYKFIQDWKRSHNGELPKNYKEKNQLKELIREGIRKSENGVPEQEDNFDEAIRHVNTALTHTKVPSEVQQIFDDPCCRQLTSESKPFWILARAVQEFVANEGSGSLPLRGNIPDMTADSERYIQLQNVYRDQSNQDICTVTNYIQTLLQSLGRDEPLSVSSEHRSPSSSPGQPQDNISDSDIKLFCRNASFLRVIRTRSLSQEYAASCSKITDLASRLDNTDEDDELVHYIMLRVVDRFRTEFNRYPGAEPDSMEPDIAKLKGCLCKMLQEWGVNPICVKDDFVHEYCRYGASELHSVAAFMGGAAAQEVIKMIVCQFIPVNNTFIYNAMKQSSLSVEL
ncbi:hypothetical protein CAPTEDRAFT_19394 [Capitella teleta]|uniref:NEDD8-activating enzyme E1 regulatory subunit n=1 Tax=Capitella teleta TaxID=283909 RepID=R7TTJ5_CAPTE|nr:hypothetical protein CAPTEDRAFT_19394 [Capitella teleta]|eukprot:ELT96932.1 hypothetical protein CAPTEDRAFT_19394 [Capitella teleta]